MFCCSSVSRSRRCACPSSGMPLWDASSTLYDGPVRCCSSIGILFMDVKEFPTSTIVFFVGMHFWRSHSFRVHLAVDCCVSSMIMVSVN